jgi:hypothetical protein
MILTCDTAVVRPELVASGTAVNRPPRSSYRRPGEIAMPFHSRTRVTVALALILPLLAGCSGARLFTWPWQKDKIITADAKNPVHRIVCMWEPSEGRRPDGMPARGFAGQILFFTRTSSTPVRVEGDVKIWVWDDQGPNGNPTVPISEFDFLKSPEGDTWNRHLTVTTLGPSYNVFVPYMRRGGHQARCALQIQLVGNGDRLLSTVATIVLPGPSVATEDPSLPPTNLPAPTRTVSHFVDGPFGRQPVGQPGSPSVLQPETPAIGAFVKSPSGVSVTAARKAPFASPGGVPASTAGNAALASSAASGGTPVDADRLARIEQMLEQLAAQQRASMEMDPAARTVDRLGVQTASGTGSFTPSEAVQGAAPGAGFVTPAAFEQPPTPAGVTYGRRGGHGSTATAPPAEPGRLDDMRLDHTSRRLQPRPSWFDESSQSTAPPSDSSHPLRGSATGSWPGQY